MISSDAINAESVSFLDVKLCVDLVMRRDDFSLMYRSVDKSNLIPMNAISNASIHNVIMFILKILSCHLRGNVSA